MRIYKYLVSPYKLVTLPVDAKILHIGTQADGVCLWAIVSPDAEHVTRRIAFYATGQEITDTDGYIGTFKIDEGNGELVFHAFDRGNV